jgi:putative NIF3 family GTP cyclohydrolase 1 type 2
MLYLNDIAQFLDRYFAIERYSPSERGGVYIPSTRPIKRLGLALEPWENLPQWVEQQNLDALFLHRPWQLRSELVPDIGVLSYHLPFDERMTLGFNPRLAEVLFLSSMEVLGEKQGRAIGAIGNIPQQNLTEYLHCLTEIFGGRDEVYLGKISEVSRIAIVGAMNDALVREAATRGAGLYVTGQMRQPAAAALEETGMSAIAVGHRRCELWGLKTLAGLLRDRFSCQLLGSRDVNSFYYSLLTTHFPR